MVASTHRGLTVATVVLRWGAQTVHERACERVETNYSRKMNARAVALGDDPDEIRSRVIGDIALAMARFGQQDDVRWVDGHIEGLS